MALVECARCGRDFAEEVAAETPEGVVCPECAEEVHEELEAEKEAVAEDEATLEQYVEKAKADEVEEHRLERDLEVAEKMQHETEDLATLPGSQKRLAATHLAHCPDCGHEMSPTAERCPKCGKALHGTPGLQALIILGVVAVVVLLAALAYGLFF